MSTQPNLTPQWKEEVNRRLAAHRSRKTSAAGLEATPQSPAAGVSRAAQAAARVAARYSNAPSYSQMQAEEARVAVRAAEIATKVALEAQAVAESALAEMHAATQPSRGPAVVQPIAPVRAPEPPPAAPAELSSLSAQALADACPPAEAVVLSAPAPAPEPVIDRALLGIRWDPDLPVARSVEHKPAPSRHPHEEFDLSVEDWWSPAEISDDLRNTPIEVGENELVHANLIQFPRELVATRKMRPRRAEGQYATEAEAQLSIFEVDPGAVSTEVQAPVVRPDGPEPTLTAPEWSGMHLDTHPFPPFIPAPYEEESLPVAPISTRLMATVVDCALILAGFVITGFFVASNVEHPPFGKTAEILGVAALGVIGLLYYALFFSIKVSTPGMKYARIDLCTFDGQNPTRAQLRRRLGAMVLSLLPVGLGFAWSIFDEDHLSWHDRYSQTYLRQC